MGNGSIVEMINKKFKKGELLDTTGGVKSDEHRGTIEKNNGLAIAFSIMALR